MVLSIKTNNNNKDHNNLEYLFDFSNLNKENKLFSEEIKKVVDKFKSEALNNIWLDELFV